MRAVMEGVTLNLSIILDIFRARTPITEITVIGGGAKGAVWRKIMADVYQAEILKPNYLEEATSMGAAIIGGVGCGVFKDFDVADRFIQITDRVTPATRNREVIRGGQEPPERKLRIACPPVPEIRQEGMKGQEKAECSSRNFSQRFLTSWPRRTAWPLTPRGT